MNFRDTLPPRETDEEKRVRLKRERQQAAAYMRFRMDIIAQTYSVHLKDLFLTAAYRIFLKNCGKEVERMRSAAAKAQELALNKYLEVNDRGEVKLESASSKQKIPRRFYRTTKLASWRIYRHHHDRSGAMPAPAASKGVYFPLPRRDDEGICSYKDYVNKVAHVLVTSSAKYAQMAGESRRGSFLMLSLYEKHVFRKQIKVTRELTEKKMEEQEDQGRKVVFKGKGLPGQKISTSGRSSRCSRASISKDPNPSDVESESKEPPVEVSSAPCTETETVSSEKEPEPGPEPEPQPEGQECEGPAGAEEQAE